jgi:hypothetical protein
VRLVPQQLPDHSGEIGFVGLRHGRNYTLARATGPQVKHPLAKRTYTVYKYTDTEAP